MNALIVTRYFYPVRNGLSDHTELVRRLWSEGGGNVSIICESVGSGRVLPDFIQGTRVYEFSGLRNMMKVISMAVKEQRPDLILYQYVPHMWGRAGIAPHAAFVPLMLGALYRIPVISYLHELFYNWSLRPRRLIPALFHRMQLVPIILASQSVIVTNANREKKLRWGFWKHKVFRIPCGNVSGRKDAAHHRPPYPWPYAAWFGTLSEDQRLEQLAGAFREVAAKHRELRLVLVGGYDRNSPRIRQLMDDARKHGLEDRMIFRGYADDGELSDILHGSQVNLFVAASGPSGRRGVVAAYCRSGRAIVSVQGNETDPEFVHRENIYLVPAGNAKALAEGICSVIEDAALRGRLERGAKELYAAHFSDQAVLRKLNQVCERAMHGTLFGGSRENLTNH